MMKLVDILQIKFAGNFADDKDKFEVINAFLRRPEISPEEKWEADHHASFCGMGEQCERPADYKEYYSNPDNF